MGLGSGSDGGIGYNLNGSGGLVVGSSAIVEKILNPTTGVSIAGSSTLETSYYFIGGTTVSGSASVEYFSSPSNIGGVKLGSSSQNQEISTNTTSGGSTLSGIADNYQFYYSPSGALVAGGSADTNSFLTTFGGLKLGGTSSVTFFDVIDGTGGMKIGGNANVNSIKHFIGTTDGQLIEIESSSSYGVTVRYISSGSVELSGSFGTNVAFQLDTTFLWHVRGFVVKDVTFLWDAGQLPMYWYRVIGKSRDGSQCNLISDPCCQKFIVNVHARSLAELCNKLRSRKFVLPIDTVQKFSRPANPVLSSEDCVELIPVEICSIPECFDFCVDYDLKIFIKSDITKLQVDAFLDYEGVDGVYVGGSSTVSYFRNVPNFPHVSTGGVVIEGSFPVVASDYAASGSGEVSTSGEAVIKSSAWDYIGGIYPYDTGILFGESAETLPQIAGDKPWSLTERALANDSLYTSTDISYGKLSELLMVSFDVDLPEDVNILSVTIEIDRLTTQVNVKDYDVYLTSGDDVISANLAKLTDWPFVETTATYELTSKWDGSDLTLDDLQNVGVALRVKANTSLPITIARVDFITIQVKYEELEHQKIKVDGNSGIVSSAWSWSGSGSLETYGDSQYKNGKKHIGSGGISIFGSYGLAKKYTSSGEVICDGNSDCRPSFQDIVASGGIKSGGIAEVIPYFEYGTGGIKLGSSAAIVSVIRELGSGGFELSGISPLTHYRYSMIGGVEIGGEPKIVSTNWHYAGSGSLSIEGEVDLGLSHLGTFTQEMSLDMSILVIDVDFDSDVHVGDAVGISTRIPKCGCISMPFKVNFEHDLARSNNLEKFLSRNRLTLPTRFELLYNSSNDSWQRNFHFKGLSPDANSSEIWNLVFELQCTNLMGGVEIGREVWKLAIEIVRKNLTTGIDFDTRMMFGIYKDTICARSDKELNFRINYDTKFDIAIVTPDSNIYQTLLFDNIGLFKTPYWLNNPEINLMASQSGLLINQTRTDLTEEILS